MKLIIKLLIINYFSCLNVLADEGGLYRQMLPDMLEQHPAVRAAEQQKFAAEREVEGVRWQYFPTPSFGVENSDQKSQFTDTKTRFARLQQPLWTGGRLTAQSDRAQAQLDLAGAAWREQRHNLAIRWLELWAESVAAKHRIDAYVESETMHLRYIKRVQARAKEGQIARSEIELSISRLANVQAELELARAQQQQVLSKLRQMWGRPWAATHTPSLPTHKNTQSPFTYAPITFASGAVSDLQPSDDHPLLHKSRAQIQLAQTEVDFARARLLPEVYARGEVVHGNISGEVRRAYIGMTTSLGGGLSNLSSIGAAQNRVEAQRQELDVRRKEISDQLAVDYLQSRSQFQRAHQLQQSLEAADAYLKSSEIQFDNGRRSWQELMNSAREKAQLRVQLADTTAQAWLAAERLRLNTQGLDVYLAQPTR